MTIRNIGVILHFTTVTYIQHYSPTPRLIQVIVRDGDNEIKKCYFFSIKFEICTYKNFFLDFSVSIGI